MEIVFLIPEYFLWHYTKALRLTLNIVTNFMWFVYHFFSIPLLWRTIFSPWQVSRVARAEQRVYAHAGTRGSIVIQTCSQIFGTIMRIFVLGFGLVLCCAVAVAGFVLFVVWLFLPLILVSLIFLAFKNIFF